MMKIGKNLIKVRAEEHAGKVFEARNRAFRILYDTVMEVEGVGEEETFAVLCRNLRRISGARCGALASYDPNTGEMVLEAVSFEDKDGVNSETQPGIASMVPRETIREFEGAQLMPCREHKGCLVNIFPESELNRFTSGVESNCYRLSCIRDGNLIAAAMIQLPPGKKIELKDMIDIYLNLAGVIIQRVYLNRNLRFERAQFLSIFDSIEEIIYVVDPFTHEIIFTNKHFQDTLGKNPEGGICYRDFQNLDKPCDFCTNDIILDKKGKTYRWEHYNSSLKKHYLITDRIIRWPDGRDLRFELAIDITQQKLAEDKLNEYGEKLEEMVDKKTAELRKTVELVTGREVRMLGLKKAIKLLRGQIEEMGMVPAADDPIKE